MGEVATFNGNTKLLLCRLHLLLFGWALHLLLLLCPSQVHHEVYCCCCWGCCCWGWGWVLWLWVGVGAQLSITCCLGCCCRLGLDGCSESRHAVLSFLHSAAANTGSHSHETQPHLRHSKCTSKCNCQANSPAHFWLACCSHKSSWPEPQSGPCQQQRPLCPVRGQCQSPQSWK